MGLSWLRKYWNNHTCGVACNEIKNYRFTSKLIKELIRYEVQDKSSVKLKDIIERFRRDNGRSLSYYYTYTEKKLALKEIHGDDSLSYHHLISYINQLRKSNPNSYVVLETIMKITSFCDYSYLFVLAFESFTSTVLCYFWMEHS